MWYSEREAAPQSTEAKKILRSTSAMQRLFGNNRVHLIFGSSTDVGKTIVSAGLVRYAARELQEERKTATAVVNYIKPLQCGGSDENFVANIVAANSATSWVRGHTLFAWDSHASPHYASRMENKPVSDEEILMRLQAELRKVASLPGITYVEGAGGVLSPASASIQNTSGNHSRTVTSIDSNKAWGWSTQADLYRSLNLPVVLIGDCRLGGISSTLTALEALLFRGYSIDALVMIRTSGLEQDCINVEACREYLSRPALKDIFPLGNDLDPK